MVSMDPTVEIIVSGKVQGVFYRQSAREKALELGLRGYVENMSNGNVRLIVTGPDDKLEALYQWCRVGPPKAEVKGITKTTIPVMRVFEGFEIKK